MITALRNKLLVLSALLLVALSFGSLLAPAPAGAATNKEEVCRGAGLSTSGAGGADCTSSGPSVNSVIRTAINILSVIVGIIAVIMIIVAGVKFVTSGGEASNVSSAKNTILYAVIGLIIVALAQTIARFVLSNVSKTQ